MFSSVTIDAGLENEMLDTFRAVFGASAMNSSCNIRHLGVFIYKETHYFQITFIIHTDRNPFYLTIYPKILL